MTSMTEAIKGMLMVDIRDIIKILLLCLSWYLADKVGQRIIKRLFRVAELKIQNSDKDTCGGAVVQRINTIRQLVTQLARIVIAISMMFWLMDSFGVDVRPIIAGIGVVGLGISLAAQNVIRDFINGMLILIEDQYNVGDWIELNGLSGSVERFTLRATKLRDFNGNLVVIPNSLIQTVVNCTKQWSVAVVKVGITYESDCKKALLTMAALGDEMSREKDSAILEAPSVQGITEFSANSVDMRIIIKTTPGSQWEVARKYRIRLKDLFERDGISFAYPQVVLHKGDTKVSADCKK